MTSQRASSVDNFDDLVDHIPRIWLEPLEEYLRAPARTAIARSGETKTRQYTQVGLSSLFGSTSSSSTANVGGSSSSQAASKPSTDIPMMQKIIAALNEQAKRAAEAALQIFPPKEKIFRALAMTPPQNVKVVILSMGPYYYPRQADGLCFSADYDFVSASTGRSRNPPRSEEVIFRVVANNYSDPEFGPVFRWPSGGSLAKWAERGVLLLNVVLTVTEGKPGSHADCGWQGFTHSIIKMLNDKYDNICFLLWGSDAKKLQKLIDDEKHVVLTAPHPVDRENTGFSGCMHFATVNAYRARLKLDPIDWTL